MKSSAVKAFYDDLRFPGCYQSLDVYGSSIHNRYLDFIDRSVSHFPGAEILDVGCGTGLISNTIASRYTECNITAVDFSDAIDHGVDFAKEHGITNVDWIKRDFLQWEPTRQFDVIICQGVLHHIPEWPIALDLIKRSCRAGGVVIMGLYHPFGKILRRYLRINYHDADLQHDQEHNPFELSFDRATVEQMFLGWCLVDHYPPGPRWTAPIAAVLNSRNGGLFTYTWRKHENQ